MIRVGAAQSYVRVDFNVNNCDYYVERRNNRHHNKIALYKKENNDRKNITGTGIDVTNRQIKQLIGGLDSFLATGLYYDAINDILKTKPADRMRLMIELFGMVDNGDIIREIKNNCKEIKGKIDKLIKPRMENPQLQYDEINEKIIKLNEERASLLDELSQTENKIQDYTKILANIRPCADVIRELKACENHLADKNNILSTILIDTDIKFAEPVTLTTSEYKKLFELSNTYIESPDEISREIFTLAARLPSAPVSDKIFSQESAALQVLDDLADKLQKNNTATRPIILSCENVEPTRKRIIEFITYPY